MRPIPEAWVEVFSGVSLRFILSRLKMNDGLSGSSDSDQRRPEALTMFDKDSLGSDNSTSPANQAHCKTSSMKDRRAL
jgi:hypothetical protein